MPFPKETNIFGLAYAGIRDKDKLDVIVLDDLERLRIVAPNGKYLWSSKDNFGGTNNFYDTTKKKDLGYHMGRRHPGESISRAGLSQRTWMDMDSMR